MARRFVPRCKASLVLVKCLALSCLLLQAAAASAGSEASLSGRVTLDGSPAVSTRVLLLEPDNAIADAVLTDSEGNYIFEAIETGTYYAMADISGGNWLKVVYPDILCTMEFDRCPLGDATPIEIMPGAMVKGIDMVSLPGSRIRGTVLFEGSGLPASGGSVVIYDSDGDFIGFGPIDANGEYTAERLVGSPYRLVANGDEFRARLWDGHPCPDPCDPMAGDPVTVELGQEETGIDFEVTALGAIEGTARDAVSGEPVAVPSIRIFDENGNDAGSVLPFSNQFRIPGLETGTYYLVAGAYRHIDQLWQGISCIGGCDATLGTPVDVTVGQTTGGVDFELIPYGNLEGRLSAAVDGSLLAGRIGLFDEQGHLVGERSIANPQSMGEYSFLDVLPGQYRVMVIEAPGYRLEAWNDLPCPPLGCDPLAGDLITVDPGLSSLGIDFALEPTTALFVDNFENGNIDAWSGSTVKPRTDTSAATIE